MDTSTEVKTESEGNYNSASSVCDQNEHLQVSEYSLNNVELIIKHEIYDGDKNEVFTETLIEDCDKPSQSLINSENAEIKEESCSTLTKINTIENEKVDLEDLIIPSRISSDNPIIVSDHSSCPVCRKGFQSEEQRERHLESHFENRLVLCDHCGTSFTSKNDFLVHSAAHNAKRRKKNEREADILLKCEICHREFYQQSHLDSHVETHAEKIPSAQFEIRSFVGEFCGIEFAGNSQLQCHLQDHNAESNSESVACSDRLIVRENSDSRENRTQKDLNHANGKRKRSANSRTSSKDIPKPADVTFRCEICSNVFTSQEDLDLHISKHSGSVSLTCEICNKSHTSVSELQLHLKIHNSLYRYNCSICPKRYIKKSHYVGHMLTHETIREFKCPVCFKQYTTEYKLKQHANIHSQEPLECGCCSEKFAKAGDLVVHLKVHETLLPFQCDVCLIQFKTNGSWIKHRLTHRAQQQKYFECAVCAEKYFRVNDMVAHLRVHNTLAPHQCDVCLVQYKGDHSLMRHRFVHRDHKLLECGVCSEKFKARKDLDKHLLTHKS